MADAWHVVAEETLRHARTYIGRDGCGTREASEAQVWRNRSVAEDEARRLRRWGPYRVVVAVTGNEEG